MNTHRTPRRTLAPWRLALAASGVALVAGGSMHPAAHPHGTLREGLAMMAADPAWVPSHSLTLTGAVLLAAALWAATRDNPWAPAVQRRLRLAALVVSAYVVEVAFHLGAVVDAAALVEGGPAPVAWTHIVLSAVLYPASGAAVAAFAWALVRTERGPRRAVAVVGVAAGTLHGLSVPVTLLLPDTETSPLFAAAAILLALWAVGTGLLSAPRAATLPRRNLQRAA